MLGIGSPRTRRLCLFFVFFSLIFYSLLLVVSPNNVHQSLKSSVNSWFDEDDNNSILRKITNSDLDLSFGSSKDDKLLDGLIAENPQLYQTFQDFYQPLFHLMNSKRNSIPDLEPVKRSSDEKGALGTKSKLLEYLTVPDQAVKSLKAIHKEIFNALPSAFPKNLYKGTGIVLIGGAQFSWLSLLSIKSIRSFGCKLPIELIIPTPDEYEYDLCHEILPSLDGKCVLLYKMFGEEIMKEVEFKGYQYKSLALIVSSFEKMLLLDSDNILVTNPERFFKEEPFISTGLITWPDYWTRTTSPYLYEIMDIKVDETTQVRDGKWLLSHPKKVDDISTISYHDLNGTFPDLSSESGQILINKSNHVKTLVLSFFYNLYGPGFFYPLISQGADGEGDKDTFIIAAIKSGEDYYQVHSEIQSFGWFEEGNFQGVSMGQRNFIDDYQQLQKLLELQVDEYLQKHPEDLELKGLEHDYSEFDVRAASVFTVHANYPKLNPYQLYKDQRLKNSKGEEVRMYSDIANFLPEPFDFELVQFKRMQFLLCDMNISLKYFNEISREELCGFIDGHLNFLKENPVEINLKV